jgi:hypothetical protein
MAARGPPPGGNDELEGEVAPRIGAGWLTVVPFTATSAPIANPDITAPAPNRTHRSEGRRRARCGARWISKSCPSAPTASPAGGSGSSVCSGMSRRLCINDDGRLGAEDARSAIRA